MVVLVDGIGEEILGLASGEEIYQKLLKRINETNEIIAPYQ